MTGMYYKMPDAAEGELSFSRLGAIAAGFLLPIEGVTRPQDFMGLDPDTTAEPVQLVFSQAEKAYKDELALDETLDAGVRKKPLVVVDVVASTGEVSDVLIPLPQNRQGPDVVMPVL
jgi:hypothetical protein